MNVIEFTNLNYSILLFYEIVFEVGVSLTDDAGYSKFDPQ